MSPTDRWRINLLIRTLATRHRTCATVRLRRIGLYPGQETVLLALDRFGSMTQRQLVERIGVEPPTLSAVASKLEAAGYIARKPCPGDRRSTLVSLTERGRALLPDIREIGLDLAEVTLNGMDAEQVETLMAGLRHAIGNLENEDATRSRC